MVNNFLSINWSINCFSSDEIILTFKNNVLEIAWEGEWVTQTI